ncbi:MAG TPA: ATP synthase F1 subunit gamma [Fimbriimonadaceae bacterium]|nr:ATP synthase F1 subunit gamma [Fimbriimonadaceae bacterium]
MATLKQIRQRIRTAKNIQQITRAMKLVAAARLTKAKTRVEEARPYSEKMREFIGSIGAGGDLPDNPLLARRPVKKACLVLMTAERGLCGSFNTNLLKKAGSFFDEQEVETSMIGVGKKGAAFFRKRDIDVVKEINLPTAGPELSHAVELTKTVREMFVEGEADAIYVLYSKFYSPIRQEPTVVQVLPIEPPTGEGDAKAYEFEPEPEALLDLLLPKYLLTVILQAMLESSASEHGARMTAMTSATDNAGKMIDNLTLTANRARQAGITKEILEIVGGAEALKA